MAVVALVLFAAVAAMIRQDEADQATCRETGQSFERVDPGLRAAVYGCRDHDGRVTRVFADHADSQRAFVRQCGVSGGQAYSAGSRGLMVFLCLRDGRVTGENV